MKNSEREGRAHYPYTLDSYENDIKNAMQFTLGPYLGAEMAAASKRVKQEILFSWLDYVAHKENLDLTPTLANHLVKGWFDRSISRPQLMKWFAITGRSADDKSEDHHRAAELIGKYRPDVQRELGHAIDKMQSIREEVKELIQKEKSDSD